MMTTNNKAAVNLSAKDLFARVLATENIHVVHDGSAQTASFNTGSRVLRLPRWREMSGQLYDMLVAHEVGHALFTPSDMSAILQLAEDHGVDAATAKDYVNVVEDARIERLMKQKFPGLRRDFINAYRDLIDRGFFGSEEEQEKYDLIDRINLHYKVGTVGSTIDFDADEQSFLNDIDGAETWDDIIRISGELLDYAAAEKQEQEEEINPPQGRKINLPGEEKGESEDEGEDIGRKEPTDEESDESSKSTPPPTGKPEQPGEQEAPPTSSGLGRSKTMEKFEKELERLRDTGYGSEQVDNIVSVPVCKPEDAIIDWTQLYGVEGGIDDHYTDERLQNDASAEIQQFLDESRKICRGMAQEFMRKQKATAFRRATIAKTGILDMERIVNYKWSEDIFRKNTILPEGKNHGLVILVDWSGSMANVMQDTIRQAIQMAMFCRMVNIPFEVFSFSTYGETREDHHSRRAFSWKDGDGNEMSHSSLTMRNYLSSRMPKQKFYDACRRMSIMALSFDWGSNIMTRRSDHLGGTPLDDALYVLANWVPKYRAENSIEILNTLVISDGYTTSSPVSHQDVVRDGHHYFRADLGRGCSTERSLDILRHKCPGTKIIQFFLHDAKGIKNMWGLSSNHDEMEKMIDFYRKNKWVIAADKKNFDERFIMFGKNAVQNTDGFTEMGRSDSETITKIRNSFVKSMKQTGTSRAMLNRFIDIIA